MKTTVISNTPINPKEIDFSKKILVKHKQSDSIMFTTGGQTNDRFSGVVLITDNPDNPIGYYSDSWFKSSFILVDYPVTIKFEP